MYTKILMADNCTKQEAINHLKNGTIVYNITEEPWDFSKTGITLEEIKVNGRRYDMSYVIVDDVEYVIEYIL